MAVQQNSIKFNRRGFSVWPTPDTSFEDLFDNYNDNLHYVGDFEKGSPGYRYIERKYNENPGKYIDEADSVEMGDTSYDGYVDKINRRASEIDWAYKKATDGDAKAARWVKGYERRLSRIERGLSVG